MLSGKISLDNQWDGIDKINLQFLALSCATHPELFQESHIHPAKKSERRIQMGYWPN